MGLGMYCNTSQLQGFFLLQHLVLLTTTDAAVGSVGCGLMHFSNSCFSSYLTEELLEGHPGHCEGKTEKQLLP